MSRAAPLTCLWCGMQDPPPEETCPLGIRAATDHRVGPRRMPLVRPAGRGVPPPPVRAAGRHVAVADPGESPRPRGPVAVPAPLAGPQPALTAMPRGGPREPAR
jgi:hypothetical protein